MTKKYSILRVETKEVCIPSADYYSRPGDWQTEEVASFGNVITYENKPFDSIEEAEQFLTDMESQLENGQYIIQPVYIIKK